MRALLGIPWSSRRTTPSALLHPAEASFARQMLAVPYGAVMKVRPGRAERLGPGRLWERGWVTLSADTQATDTQPTGTVTAASDVPDLVVAWVSPGAAACAARLLVRPDRSAAQAEAALWSMSRKTQHDPGNPAVVVDRVRGLPATGVELATALAHHYLYSGVRGLTITQHPDDYTRVIEQHRNGTETTLMVPPTLVHPEDLRVDLIRPHDGFCDLPDTVVAVLVQSAPFAARLPVAEWSRTPVRVNFDTLAVTPDALSGAAMCGLAADWSRSPRLPPDWCPALLADALTALDAPTPTTPAAFVDWAEQHLRVPVACVGQTHHARVDPHTATLSYRPDQSEAYETEHFLYALGADREYDGTHACAAAQHTLQTHTQFSGGGLDPVRTVVRAVQYLDAGLDLGEAADFLFFAVPPGPTAHLIATGGRDPAQIRALLTGWVRDLWTHGFIDLDRVPSG